jgi:hypothetical protein
VKKKWGKDAPKQRDGLVRKDHAMKPIIMNKKSLLEIICFRLVKFEARTKSNVEIFFPSRKFFNKHLLFRLLKNVHMQGTRNFEE